MTTLRSGGRSALPLRHACACAVAAICGPSLAQPASSPIIQSEPLEPVVVSGSREGTSLRRTPAPITRLGPATLDAQRATFVGELLDKVPGVYVSDLANEQHSMAIRHPITTNPVYLYMEDGIPIRPLGLFNHNALYEINLEGVDAIEVLKGPASSLYGSNAVGGAVNFLTRAAHPEQPGALGFQLSDQGYQRMEFQASHTGEQPDDARLRLSGYVSARRGGWQEHNEADKRSLTVRHDTRAGRASLKTVLSYNQLLTDMPGTLRPSQYAQDIGRSQQTFTWRKVEAARLSTALEGSWNEGGLSTVTLYARSNRTDQLPSYLIRDLSPTAASGRLTLNRFASLGVDARHRQNLGSLRWITGVQIEHSPMEGFEQNVAISRTGGRYVSPQPGTVRRDYAVEIANRAVYTQLEWQPADSVTVVAGARHDHIGYDYTNHLTPSATTGAPSEQRRYDHTSPKLGLTWRASPQWTLFGNISQGFTPPEVSSQYGGALTAPDLRPSTFDNVDLGARWVSQDRRSRLEATLYRLDGHDEVLSYATAPGASVPVNAGQTRHEGLELGLQHGVTPALDVSLAASVSRHVFVQYRVSPEVDFSGRTIPGAPRLMARGELNWSASPQWRLGAEVQHLSGYWMNNANTVRYGGHALLHLKTRWQQGPWSWWATLFNAADRRYAEVASSTATGALPRTAAQADAQDTITPGAPRTLQIGLRYQFGGQP